VQQLLLSRAIEAISRQLLACLGFAYILPLPADLAYLGLVVNKDEWLFKVTSAVINSLMSPIIFDFVYNTWNSLPPWELLFSRHNGAGRLVADTGLEPWIYSHSPDGAPKMLNFYSPVPILSHNPLLFLQYFLSLSAIITISFLSKCSFHSTQFSSFPVLSFPCHLSSPLFPILLILSAIAFLL